MSRKTNLSIMIFIWTFMFSLVPLYAQEERDIINERFGKKIDEKESEQFKPYHDINGFHSADYQKLSDNRFPLKVACLYDQTADVRIIPIQQSEVSIKEGKFFINHFTESPIQKVHEDSSKQKTFCFSIGGGIPLFDHGSKLLADLNHLPITFQLLKFPIAFMISLDYSSGVNSAVYNLLYIKRLSKDKNIHLFGGGGIGSFKIHERTKPYYMDYNKQKYTLYNFEAGCKATLWNLGSFAKFKYLYTKGADNSLLFIFGFDVNICI